VTLCVISFAELQGCITSPISTTFLLLSKWPTPFDYAASANPEGAKLLFAFSSFDQ
jgi:hypothetical protein